jgi:hypothetical protein
MCGFLKLNPLSYHQAQLALSRRNLYRILISCKAIFARLLAKVFHAVIGAGTL